MRSRRASASNGILNRRMRFSHETVLLAILAVIALWIVVSLVQTLSLNGSLNRQAAELHQENAALKATNDGYHRDMNAVSSGAAAEEEARKDGYARGTEKLVIIGTPPSPTPAPTPRPAAHHGADGPLPDLWHWITRAKN
jgi:cell division protein FtsB